jgi:hypothetical protein
VSAAVLVLANAVFVAVVPVIETAYEVGAATEIEAGMVNVTRRVLPAIVVTAVDGVVTAAPPAAGSSETVTAVSWIVPVGKPEPVRLMTVIPGCPEAGEAAGERVTVWPLVKTGQSRAVTAAMTACAPILFPISFYLFVGRFRRVAANNDSDPTKTATPVAGWGTPAVPESDVEITAKSVPATRVPPAEGNMVAVAVSDAAVKVPPPES